MVERRLGPRALTSLVIEIYEQEFKTLIAVGKLTDISESGVGIQTTTVFLNSEELVLRFLLNLELVMTLKGIIIWSKTDGRVRYYGVRFHDVVSSDNIKLKKFVKEYTGKGNRI